MRNIGYWDILFGIWCALLAMWFVFVPLGVWKAIEILIWIFKHVKIGVV